MMAEPLVYEADREAYLDRQRRMQRLLERLESADELDIEAWVRDLALVQTEVAELPLVIGARYRIRMLGGKPRVRRIPWRVDGREGELDIPTVSDAEYISLEGVFLTRRRAPFPWCARPLLFDVGGQYALLTDSDVLSLEEVR